MLVNALGHLTSRPPPLETTPTRLCEAETQVSIARVENSKNFLFKESKLFVWMMDLWES